MNTTVLRTFDNYFKANIILTRLQDQGVHCFLVDEYTVTIDPILSNAIGGIKLAVISDEAEIAEKILQGFEEEYLRSAECPKCFTHDILLVPKPGTQNYLTAILTWLFSSYAVATENVYQCQQCGFESMTLPESRAEFN